MKPISPSEAEGNRVSAIEPEIIQAVNELIVENLRNGRASFKQDEVINRYFKIKGMKNTNVTRGKLYRANQLDFESIFREIGWDVKYHKPDYTESYDPYFVFKKK